MCHRRVKIVDIMKTDICPLAKYVRKRLKYMCIHKGVKCVFSDELPAKYSITRTDGSKFKKSAYGTISYLPAVFGLTCASVVIKHIADYKESR